jgi:hypothetical protein
MGFGAGGCAAFGAGRSAAFFGFALGIGFALAFGLGWWALARAGRPVFVREVGIVSPKAGIFRGASVLRGGKRRTSPG